MLDEKLVVGTEIASWYLFHPDDLAHRLSHPRLWPAHEFAIAKEFAAGNLIAIDTKGDGEFLIRFTDQELTEAEQCHLGASATFRLRVRHDRLLLDGGDLVPSAEMSNWNGLLVSAGLIDESELGPEPWIEIPNGNYQVTVHRFNFQEGQEDDLPDYTVQFQLVKNLNAIDSPPSIPELDYASESVSYAYDDPSWRGWRVSDTIVLQSEYALLEWSEMFFPGFPTDFIPSEEQFQQFELIRSHPSFENGDKPIVVGYALAPEAIGTVAWLSCSSLKYDSEAGKHVPHLRGLGTEVVRLVRVFERDNLMWAEVEQYQPSNEPADAAQVEHLKQLFAQYAATSSEIAQLVDYPQFYAERVASVSVARELSWAIAHAIDLTPQVQRDLLIASDRDFVQGLVNLLEQKLQVEG